MASKITYKRLYERERKYRLILRIFSMMMIALIVLMVLHTDSRLREYEENQPARVVEAFILSLNEEDSSSLKALEDVPISSAPSAMTAKDYILSRTKNKSLAYNEILRPQEGLLFYEITSQGERILELTLKSRAPGKGEHYKRWEIESVKPVISSDSLALDFLSSVNSGNYEPLLQCVPPSLYPCETNADFLAYLNNTLCEKSLSVSAISGNSDMKADYLYTLDDAPFITVSFENSAEKGWHMKSADAHFLRPETYTVLCSSTSQVTVNGHPLPDGKYAVASEESTHALHLPEERKNPVDLSMRRYSISYAFSRPEFGLIRADGTHAELLEADTIFTEKPAALLPEFSDLENGIRNAANAIARFTVGKEKIETALRYVEFGSPAYRYLYEYDLWKSVNAGSASMDSFEITGMTKLADDCFAVDVSAVFKASYTQTNVIEYPLSYTFYYRDVKGKWLIYDFVSH